MQEYFVPCMSDLDRSDRLIVKRLAEEHGVSEEVLLAALYKIIRKFQDFQVQNPKFMSGEDYYRYLVDLGLIEQPSTS
jgi:hypothetical protein